MLRPQPPENPISLYLDFDGTLVSFADTPDGISVAPETVELLKELYSRLDGALAIVTGRSITNLDLHLSGFKPPVAGEHGAQWRWSDGRQSSAGTVSFRSQLLKADDAFDDVEGMRIETKSSGFAIHFRQAPQWEKTVRNFVDDLIVDNPNLTCVHGNMVSEVRGRAVHKGAAIELFQKHEPFKGRTPIFIGDDVTDEDGFKVVNQAGGLSIKVGSDETCASFRLGGVEEVHDWLNSLNDTLHLGREEWVS